MTDILTSYRSGQTQAPSKYYEWRLRGVGVETLTEEFAELPEIGSNEILVRHDACGICFSDIKIINLGSEHPRLVGRDMVAEPVVMGHEVALTVIKVGDAVAHRFKIGSRYIIQADVYFKGVNLAYGYVLKGGMSQFGVVGEEVLNGDEGCYLLPIMDKTGYAEAALVEPWACVVAAYEYPNYRDGVKAGGNTLVYYKSDALGRISQADVQSGAGAPKSFSSISSLRELAQIKADATSGKGFDDVIVVGSPSPEEIESLSASLGALGVFNIVTDQAAKIAATIDIGRIHYDKLLYVGAVVARASDAKKAYTSNNRADLLSGGKTWFIGAGGPMGQMHIQRAVMRENPPKKIVVTDISDERLARVHDRFGAKAAARGIEIVSLNPNSLGDDGYAKALAENGAFDDIVCLVPSAAMISATAPYLAQDGIYNVFAGVAKGVSATLEIGDALSKNQRFVGTSGSSIDDLRHTLELVENNQLSTNASLATIGGHQAFRDGLAAVKAGVFPGKVVIFLQIEDLPLTSIDDMKTSLPTVYAKLEDGKFWTNEAEEELLKLKIRGNY